MRQQPRLGARRRTIRIGRAALPLTFLLAAACQQDPVEAPPQTGGRQEAVGGVLPAQCPADGLSMRTSDGRQFFFLGRDPSDPEVCLWNTVGSSLVSRQLHTLVSPEGEVGQQSRLGLRQLFPLRPGKAASYAVQRSDGSWMISWRVREDRTISVHAGEFRVWVVDYVEEGRFGNSFRGERTYHIDQATGAVVKLDSRVVRGVARWTPSWEALSLTSETARPRS